MFIIVAVENYVKIFRHLVIFQFRLYLALENYFGLNFYKLISNFDNLMYSFYSVLDELTAQLMMHFVFNKC